MSSFTPKQPARRRSTLRATSKSVSKTPCGETEGGRTLLATLHLSGAKPPRTPGKASVASLAGGKENNRWDGDGDGKSFPGSEAEDQCKRDGVQRDDESIAALEENLFAGVGANIAKAAESGVVDDSIEYSSGHFSSESSTYQPDSSIDVSHDGSSQGANVGVDASTQTGVPAEINVKVEGADEEIEDLDDKSAGGTFTPAKAEVEGSDSSILQDEIDESNGAASVNTTLEEQVEHFHTLYVTSLAEGRTKDATIKRRTTERNEATKRAEDAEKELASRDTQLGAYKAANLALRSQLSNMAAENGKMAVENGRLKWWLKAAMTSLALMVACLPPEVQLFVYPAIFFCTIVSFIAFLTVA